MIVSFSPPLFKQRYQFVVEFVQRIKPKKVVDLGCNDCALLKKLKFHHEIELLVGVDINGAVLKDGMYGLAPLPFNYLQPSFSSLNIQLYQGSVTQKDARLRGFDLVTSIELIEHLQPADVSRFGEVVFGYMTPVSVIVSTPNSEFNTLFRGLKGFRHSDHKFEWTRAEFRCWALKVCGEYGYEVQFTGVGQPPPGMLETFGFCSQIAVFKRISGRNDARAQLRDDVGDLFPYMLLYNVDYPSLNDANLLEKVLVAEVQCQTKRLRWGWTGEMAGERDEGLTFCQTDGEKETEVKESQTGDEDGCGEGGHAVGWRDRGRCGGQEKMESDDPLWRPVTAAAKSFGETKDLVEWSETRAPEDEEEFGMNGEGLKESYRQDRLWSCCPRIRALSGSPSHLRRLLLNSRLIRLTEDGAAVLVDDEEQDEEVGGDDLEDTGVEEENRATDLSAMAKK